MDGQVAITVDLEFFDSAFLFRGRAPNKVPEETRTLGMEGVEFILDILEEHGVRGTFFTLGEIAEQIPETVADIAARSHEIASHGYSKSHPDLRNMTNHDVRDELTKSKRILEETSDGPVEGFRAPAFALDDDVLKVVAEAGYVYDSSVVPSRRIPGFYGDPNAPRDPFASESWFSNPGVVEFPIATSPVLRLPISGAWMRLLGRRYTLRGIRQHIKRQRATVVYIHPWELVDIPKYDPIPRRVTWRTGEYTRRTLAKLIDEHASRIRTMGSLRDQFIRLEEGERTS